MTCMRFQILFEIGFHEPRLILNSLAEGHLKLLIFLFLLPK